MPTPYHELRRKYPKWAHRRDADRKHKRRKRRRRKRSRSRSRKKLVRDAQSASSEQLLTTLLTQMMLKGTLAKKHGENVVTGYADNVKPDALAPVRSRVQYRKDAADADMRDAMRSMLAAGGAAAAVAGPQAPPAFPGREATPPPGSAWG